MQTVEAKLRTIIDLGNQLSQFKDIDLVLEKILSEARTFTNCDAGSIYVREGDLLSFRYAQNDTMQQLLPPGKKLPYASFTIPINNNSIAGSVAANGSILNIPDAYEISGSFPFFFNRSYDLQTGYRTRSLLTIPLKNFRKDTIGVLQLINAMDIQKAVIPFEKEDEEIIGYFANTAAIAVERAKMTREIIMRMNKMAELRDPKETGAHVNRVAAYSVVLYEAWARTQDLPQFDIDKNRDVLRMSAMLHDVGKIAISDMILKKPGRFTDEEYQAMKLHTLLGANLFADIYSEFDESAAIVALNHHERWDGNGYPGHVDPVTQEVLVGYQKEDGSAHGKRGEEIPFFGRIVALADVYDALSCRRYYKDAWDEKDVVKMIQEGSGTQFDPNLVTVFLECLDTFREIRDLYQD
ncbi:MAG TPA: GAF domain-containing protein [Desulfuromonadales bacterium]|nr:GAF domain-containing protein [Desulfuromonadales bacterium]